MTISDIIKRVRVVIDDVGGLSDTFTSETDDALEQFVDLALALMSTQDGVEATPKEDVETNVATFKRPDGQYYTEVIQPEDFLKFISLELVGWKMPVYTLIPVSSPLFAVQYSPAKGVANGVHSPIAFITNDKIKKIIAHPAPARATGSSATEYSLRYIPTLSISNLDDKYSGALTYYAAALYHESVNEAALAKDEMAIAQNMIVNEKAKNEN
jgi:hypothetical protein